MCAVSSLTPVKKDATKKVKPNAQAATVAAAIKAAATQKANKAAADTAEETDPITTQDESEEPLDAAGNKGKRKQKDTTASRIQPAGGKPAASLRSTSRSGAGTPTGDNNEEISGARPPQYLVVTHNPTTQTDVFRPPAEFSMMISQANNAAGNPDPRDPTDQVQPSLSEPWEPTQPGQPPSPPVSGVSQPTGFNPDARDEHIGSAEAAKSGNVEAQDAYISSLHRIQGSLLEAEAPRKEALERANSLEKHCIGVATIAFAAPGGVASLLEFKNGKVVARINLRDPEAGHVEALKEQLANSHKKTDFKTPILIWAKDAKVDPFIVDKMKKRDLYGVSEEVPILKIEMSPRENQIIHEIYWTMTQPHLTPDYDPVRDRDLKPRWLTQEELNNLAIELDNLREGRKFFTLVNGQHRIVAMLSLAADLTKERTEILRAAREKRIPPAELETRIKTWSSKVRACTYRALVFESNTPEALLVDWGTNTTEEPRRGEEQAELIWMTAQRYKAMIRNFLLENPGLHRRDVFTAARIEYIRQTGVDSSMDSRPGASTDANEIDADAAPPIPPSGQVGEDQGDEAGDEGEGESGPQSKRQQRAMKKKSIAGAAAIKASSSHLSGVKNGAAVFQRIMSYSPYIELVLSTCGAYLFWNNSVRDAHGTTMLRPTGAILAVHMWIDIELLLNLASASEINAIPRIEDFVQRNRPNAKGYDEAIPVWESAFGRATSQPQGMPSWAKIQDKFGQEYARHFKTSKAQDDTWLDENMWVAKMVATHREIYYRIGADPILKEGSDQDRLFGAMLRLYALVPLGHRPLVADALRQGIPHSDTRPVCPLPRFWPLAALPCKKRISAYNRRAGLSSVPSGESIHLLTFLLGRNFPMWLYHGGIDKTARLWSRWYEINPGFTQVLLAGFEATGVGSLEARLSLVIELIEDKNLFESMLSIEDLMKKRDLSLSRIMQECAVLNSHRLQSGTIKKAGSGHFADALDASQVAMTLAEAQKAWSAAIPQVRLYMEGEEDRVVDLLKRNPVLEIISRKFWDHTQLRRWANGIPDGQPRTLIAERALAWGICLDYYERVVISECLARLPQMRTVVEFAEKICNLSQTAPWFKGLYDTATLSQLPPPSPTPLASLSPPREPRTSAALDQTEKTATSSQAARSGFSPSPPASPRDPEGPSLSLRPLAPVNYAESEIEQPGDEPGSFLPGSPHADDDPVTADEASRNRPLNPVWPMTQLSVELPTMSQVLRAQAQAQAQAQSQAQAQPQMSAQRSQSPRPSPGQENRFRSSTPLLNDPMNEPEQLGMEIDTEDRILSPATDPEADNEQEDASQSGGTQEPQDVQMGSSPKAAATQPSFAASLMSTNREVQERLADNEREPFNMCEMIQWCLPDEFSCMPILSASFLHTLDGLHLQQRSVLPVEKEDLKHLLLMEDMLVRMNAGANCIWTARADLRDELLNLAQYIARSKFSQQLLINQSAFEARNICVRFMLRLIKDFSLATHINEDEATSEIAWMVKTDGLFDNQIFHIKYDQENEKMEFWLNLKHTFPLLLQQHLDEEENSVMVRGYVMRNLPLEEVKLVHHSAESPIHWEQWVQTKRSAYTVRGSSYVRHIGKSTAAPASFIANMGVQLSGIDPGANLLNSQDGYFKVRQIPENVLNRYLMQSIVPVVGWGLCPWGQLLRQQRNELATELAASWEEQSQIHLTEYSVWLKQHNLHARSTSSVLPNRVKYFRRQEQMLDEELSRREAQYKLPHGRPLFMPGSSVDPESGTQDDSPLLNSLPSSPGGAPLPDEPASPRHSPRPDDKPAEPLSTQETAESPATARQVI
ncbi:hypothetical protein RhiLY_01388 [Ceratobasidium sp. AG-Ba]|nr:hypothetical protein RhiLY_01388 [Ceratobasidium sp. AG-Ba]